MLNNSRLRDTGAAIMAGLQVTRTEALRRNQNVEFVLTADDVDDSSAATVTANTAGPNWAIRVLDATATPVAPLVEARSGLEGSNQTDPAALYVRVSAANLPATTTTVRRLGRSNVGGTNTTYDVTPADTNLCRVNGGDLRCMRVVVTPAGRVRMCDPSIDAVANPNARAPAGSRHDRDPKPPVRHRPARGAHRHPSFLARHSCHDLDAGRVGQRGIGLADRIEAVNASNQLLAQIWMAVDRTSAASVQASLLTFEHQTSGVPADCNFSGTTASNATVTAWLNRLNTGGASGAPLLPGTTSAMQQIDIDTGVRNRVTITLCWNAPNDRTPHRHTVVAYVN